MAATKTMLEKVQVYKVAHMAHGYAREINPKMTSTELLYCELKHDIVTCFLPPGKSFQKTNWASATGPAARPCAKRAAILPAKAS